MIKIIEEHRDSISLVSLSLMSSHYSHYYDVKRIGDVCRKYGILIFIDLAHSLGVIPINIESLNVDGAVMSSSKFLCSGPGSLGGLYINPRHRGVKSGLRGWFGIDRKVLVAQLPDYVPSPEGLKRF